MHFGSADEREKGIAARNILQSLDHFRHIDQLTLIRREWKEDVNTSDFVGVEITHPPSDKPRFSEE